MAYNLQTIFTVKDNATAKIKQITKHIEQLNTAMGHLNGNFNQLSGVVNNNTKTIIHNTTVINRNSSTVNNNTNNITRNNNVRNTFISTVNRESGALKGLSSTLASIGGAYAVVAAGQKAFQETIGQAARFEQSEITIKTMFDDDGKAAKYMKFVDDFAVNSPLLNSGDMFGSTKGLLTLSKDLGQLETAWGLVERLIAADPTKSIDDAVRGMRELASGDTISLREVFNLDKGILNDVKNKSFAEQLVGIDKALTQMNITDEVTKALGETSIGQFNSLKERLGTIMRAIGEEPNSSLGRFLKRLNDGFSKIDVSAFTNRMGDFLDSITNKVISVAEWIWKWREPIAYIGGALTAAFGSLALVGIIAALASPISLIAAGISAAAVGMYALWNNSETFRGVISDTVAVVKNLWDALKDSSIGDFFVTLKQHFEGGLFTGILQRDQGAVALAVGIAQGIEGALEGIKAGFKNVADFIRTVKEQFTGGLFTGILQRDQGVVQMAIAFADGLKDAFERLKSGISTVKQYFGEFQAYLSEKIAQMSPGIETLKGVFVSVWNTLSDVFNTVWYSVLQPGLANLWDALQILGDVAVIVFNNVVVPALQFAASLFSVLWSVAGPILSLLGATLRTTFAVLKLVWDTILSPLVAFILSGVKNAFEGFTEAINIIGGAFDWVGGIIDTVASKIGDFVKKIKDVKLPDWVTKGVNATVKFVGGAIDKFDAAVNGSHYHGLREVSRNGYIARLHLGESVLPRQEAEAYRSLVRPGDSLANVVNGIQGDMVAGVSYEQVSAGITNNNTTNTYNTVAAKKGKEQPTQSQRSISIAKLADQIIVREDADVDRIADELVRKLISAEAAGAGAL